MNFLNSPQPPRLPDAPVQYQSGTMVGFINVLRLYFSRLSTTLSVLLGANGGAELELPHALLVSNEDQLNAGATVANQLTFNQPLILQGVEVRDGNEIYFERPGQYLVTFTLQVSNASNEVQEFEVWAGFNGENYPLSNTRFDLPARKNSSIFGHVVPAITGIFTVENPDEDYLTINWFSASTDVFLEHYAAGTSPDRPEIPSVIMTINFVSRLPNTP